MKIDTPTTLGMQKVTIDSKKRLKVNVCCPQAKEVNVIPHKEPNKKYPLTQVKEGLFEGLIGRRQKPFLYQLEYTSHEGQTWVTYDAYQFESLFQEEDIKLFKAGKHYTIYKYLGAHFREVKGVEGVHFAVWAPHAQRVSVIGDFNNWDGRRHTMRKIEEAGIWELFIPGLCQGDLYQFEILTSQGVLVYKTDPYGLWQEKPPKFSSRIYNQKSYIWNDTKWMEKRKSFIPYQSPINIYEVHLGSWKKHFNHTHYTYRELAESLGEYVEHMGYTHIELMGAMEHPFDGSWGYQVTGYFAPTSRYGSPDDFKYFIDEMHRRGIGVILDWVPAHFPKDAFGLEKFDGTALYEHSHPLQAEHPQWGTLIFNYGRYEVSLFLMASALSWIECFHIDGLRVDAVASMLYLDYGKEGEAFIPNCYGGRENLEAEAFLKQLNSVIYEKYPGIMMIAEESSAWKGVSRPVHEGGLGFGFKWNMGWMNDFLSYIEKDPLFRKYHHSQITFSLMYAFNENFILPLSHDEVVHGKSCMLYKMPGDEWQKFANLRTAYGYMFTHPGKKLLFMGSEFGQTREWSEARELEWHLLQYEPHQKLHQFVRDLNYFYKVHSSLWEIDHQYQGFEWIDCHNNEQSIIVFKRQSKEETLIIVVNFTPQVYKNYCIGVGEKGYFKELLNSDDVRYGGSGVCNKEPKEVLLKPCHNQPYYIEIDIPPLGISIWTNESN